MLLLTVYCCRCRHKTFAKTNTVTFVALGNGAPDLSANIAAISAGEVVLSAGALTGAAMFVQCVVAAELVALAGDAGIKCGGAMLRDVGVYALAISSVLLAFALGQVCCAALCCGVCCAHGWWQDPCTHACGAAVGCLLLLAAAFPCCWAALQTRRGQRRQVGGPRETPAAATRRLLLLLLTLLPACR